MLSDPGVEASHTVLLPVGYRVGAWEVRRPLASGKFSTVYAARRVDRGTPAHAALKVLPTGGGASRRPRHLRELVRREVSLLRSLRQPRLIRMHDAVTLEDADRPDLDGATVLVLERATSSLADAMTAGPPGPARAARILTEVCEGLVQLHTAGWVHGDLKPGNVLLMPGGNACLADFNLSAPLRGTHAYTPPYATPDYTPPELLWGPVCARGRPTRPTADIWSFGVLAHETLTGVLPFPGPTASARRDGVLRYATGSAPLRLAPGLRPAWRSAITSCLAPTHEHRAPHDAVSLLRRVG